MNCKIRRSAIVSGLVLLILLVAQNALADSVNITLSNNPAPNYDIFANVYTGPYAATVNGQPVLIVCDDFLHDTNAGQSWTATVNSLGSSSALWSATDPNYVMDYQKAAYLTLLMLATPNTQANSTTIGELSFAIWSIFAPSQVNSWLSSYAGTLPAGFISGVGNFLTQAQNNYQSGNYSNVVLYTPPCTNGSCGPPQEFIYVQVPEGGTAAAYLLAALLTCFGAMFLRPRFQT
jgi:hypothetical protein